MKWLIAGALLPLLVFGCTEDGSEEVLGEHVAIFGPAGGVLVSEDGVVRVEIPVGALDNDVEISLVAAQQAPAGSLGPAYELLGDGVVFREPIRVIFSYEPSALGGTPAVRIRVARAVSGAWDALDVPMVDTDLDRVAGLSWGLGPFAIVSAGCSSTTDCTQPKQCVRATCRHTPCTTVQDCFDGQTCDGGLCLALEPCDAAGECAATHVCIDAHCHPRGPCDSIVDCADGEACSGGRCVAGQCVEDLDCADTEVCSGGICMLGQRCAVDGSCPAGSGCVNSICMRVECTTSAECGEGMVCVELACVADRGCTSDGDCAAGRICDNLSCATPMPCLPDQTCEDLTKTCDGTVCRTLP